jgi:apolipoprotein N-acyltransferase
VDLTPNPIDQFNWAEWIQQYALNSRAHVVIFPETVVRRWNDAVDAFWEPTFSTLREQRKTMLIGATVSVPLTRQYLNTVILRGYESRPSYLQRIPVPIGMWAPYSTTSVPLRLRGPGTLVIDRQKAAVLICYEQILVWPVLTSALEKPTVLVGISNDYWVRFTTIPDGQRACLKAWGRLFRLPTLLAVNL